MAAADYSPEIKAAMLEKQRDRKQGVKPERGDTPADMARDRQRGIKEDSPQDQRIDARVAAAGAQPSPAQAVPSGHAPPHHVNAAASIAHAILQQRPPGSAGY